MPVSGCFVDANLLTLLVAGAGFPRTRGATPRALAEARERQRIPPHTRT